MSDYQFTYLSDDYFIGESVWTENQRHRVGGGKTLGRRILFRSTKIKCSGIGNKIEIGDYCRFRNVLIEVEGNNNTIHIGTGVMVYEYCYIGTVRKS